MNPNNLIKSFYCYLLEKKHYIAIFYLLENEDLSRDMDNIV